MPTTSPYQFIIDFLSEVPQWLVVYGPRIFVAAIIFTIFWLLSLLAKTLSKRDVDINLYKRPSPEAINEYNKVSKRVFYGSIFRVIFIIVGATLALLSTGVDTIGLISGLGFIGLVLAYTLSDVLKKYYAGFIILTQEPFNIGEQVEMGEISGVVKNISPTYTIVRDYHEHDVIIPNTQIVDNLVHITPIQALQRDVFRLQVDYKADVKRAIEVGEAALRNTPGVDQNVAPRGYVREIGISNTLAFYYTIPGARREQFNIRNMALQNVLKAFHEIGIEASEYRPPIEHS